MRASLIVLLLTLCAPLRAEPLAGADDPAFAAARAQWLAGEDLAALTALSALAQGGNPAAQLLLGRIDQTLRQSEEVAALGRAERIALLRAPGGLSGTNWLVARAGDLPLAAALQTAGNGYGLASDAERREALEALLAAGEAGAALKILMIGTNQGGWAPDQGWDLLVRYGTDTALAGQGLPLVGFLRDTAANPDTLIATPKQAALLEHLVITAAPPAADLVATLAGLSSTRTLGDPTRLAAAQEAAGAAPLAAPLRGLCAEACPGTVNACTFALLSAAGGVPGHVTLSPLEGVIASAEYQASPRFHDDLIAALGSNPQTPADQRAGRRAYLAQFDTCAATLLHGDG